MLTSADLPKRLLPFLAADATIGNQTFSQDSLRKNDYEAKVEFTSKVMERIRVTCYSV